MQTTNSTPSPRTPCSPSSLTPITEKFRKSQLRKHGGVCATDALEKCRELEFAMNRYREERLMLAKLAAETPHFYNPLVVFEAKKLRDRILAENA